MNVRNITPGPKITNEKKLYWLCKHWPLGKEEMGFGAKGKSVPLRKGSEASYPRGRGLWVIHFRLVRIDDWSHSKAFAVTM